MVQVDGDAVEVVHPPRTRVACSVGSPGGVWPGGIWVKHRVVDHQLAATIKQVLKRDRPTLAFERVVVVYQLPRKRAPLTTQLVAHVRELLFFGKVPFASRDPLIV